MIVSLVRYTVRTMLVLSFVFAHQICFVNAAPTSQKSLKKKGFCYGKLKKIEKKAFKRLLNKKKVQLIEVYKHCSLVQLHNKKQMILRVPLTYGLLKRSYRKKAKVCYMHPLFSGFSLVRPSFCFTKFLHQAYEKNIAEVKIQNGVYTGRYHNFVRFTVRGPVHPKIEKLLRSKGVKIK